MKKKDAFKLGLTLLLALALGACQTSGGSKSVVPADDSTSQQAGDDSSDQGTSEQGTSEQGTSEQGTSEQGTSEQGTSEQGSDSSQAAADPAVAISAITVVKEGDNAKLQISGTSENIATADFLWALGLEHTGSASGGDGKTGYIVGKAEFEAADYVLPATLNADGSFVFKYDLTALTTFVAGSYFITAAVKGVGAVEYNVAKPEIEVLDANYRYYFRNDISQKLTVCADELPPLSLTEATIVKQDGKIWAKIGGTAKAGLTQADFDAYDSFVNFQNTSNWSNTRLNKANGDFHWTLEGTKAYLYADVTFFTAGGNYNTHLNVKEATQANCKMEVEIDEHYNVQKSETSWLDINVYSKPSGTGQNDFWGNLGFKVTAGADPSVHVHNPVVSSTKQNSNSKDVKLGKCASDNFYRISTDAQGGKLVGQEDGSAGKLKKGSSYEFEINLTLAADLTNVSLIIGRSDSHKDRHLFNEAKWNEEHPDNKVTLPGQNPDKTTEDDWRYKIEVVNGGTTTEFPITNLKSASELELSGSPYYFPFVNNLVLKNGTNIIRVTRNQIGYANVFAGELRLEFETTATVALADAPAA